MNTRVQSKLALIARSAARRHRATLDDQKAKLSELERPDFLWHHLLQSFATMGRNAGARGLIGNKSNYDKLRFDVLAQLAPAARRTQVETTCRMGKIRMPGIKAGYILTCFDQIQKLGGPESAKARLLAQEGREAKIAFLKSFHGIGDKYARNIMMDVYHPEFRDTIAIDARIKALSQALGLRFDSYAAHEEFYLSVAQEAGLNGWELDRLVFSFQSEFLANA